MCIFNNNFCIKIRALTIKNNQDNLATFKKHRELQKMTTSLKLSVTTKWASFLFCLQNLQINKVLLQAFAIDKVLKQLPRDIELIILDNDVF